jgi:molybdenum cofactor biosynthesis protein A
MNRSDILTDGFGRKHDYLRISLIERCNLRCVYCMPEEGIPLRPKSHFMRTKEVLELARIFVEEGVKKIRLTGGEPLIRRDADNVIRGLGRLSVELAITTNGVIVDRFIDVFQESGVQSVNVSLDSLKPQRMASISRRDYFDKIMSNILLLRDEGFRLKVNAVLMRGVNDDEISDFIRWSHNENIHVRFIEFMPFDGNSWDKSRCVSEAEVLKTARDTFGADNIERVLDRPNDTSHNYRIVGSTAGFAIISTVTNPFCDSCNRLRLTADGKMKNCLFSTEENDLLSALRSGKDVRPLIAMSVRMKKAARGGFTDEQFDNFENHKDNRAMTVIGG